MLRDIYRIPFEPFETTVTMDKNTFSRFANGVIDAARAAYDIESANHLPHGCISHDILLANVYWLGYGSIYELHHPLSDNDVHIITEVMHCDS